MNAYVLLTAPQPAAIAVLRLRGDVQPFAARHFSRPLKANGLVHGILRDAAGEELDDPVMHLHADGETLDINLHGGPWVIESAIRLVESAGFVKAVLQDDAPLPELAVDGESDIERLVLRWLPAATTELGVRALLAQVDATTSANDHALYWLLHPPTLAIVGPPNAGKSTLANRLFGQQRSIVADVPGTTRDYVSDVTQLHGLPLRLLDTPGFRITDDPIEAQAMQLAAKPIADADLVIELFDSTQPFEPQRDVLRAIGSRGHRLAVANKSDAKPHASWQGKAVLFISANTGSNIAWLERTIAAHFGITPDFDINLRRQWTSLDHK